ncbi:MAG: hypothetical protein R8M45_12105 [Ghiorsea sp.]
MYPINKLSMVFAMLITNLALTTATHASECGLSCCIAAGVDGVSSNVGLSLSLQYDTMLMKSIKQGTSTVKANQVIDSKLSSIPMGTMGMYSVATDMVMQKLAINASYRMDLDNAFVLTVPYHSNGMNMHMGKKDMMGKVSYSDMSMDMIQGVGDVSLLYMHDLFTDADVQTRQRLSAGVGIKLPTGASDVRKSNEDLVHMMMQAGSGSWDGMVNINGAFAWGSHADGGAQWMLSPSFFYQFNTANDLGYKVGNRFNYNLSTRYRVSSHFNLKLDVNGVLSQSDTTDGTVDTASGNGAYQNTMNNSLDNVANTGIYSMFVSPGFQWLIGDSYTVSGEHRIPIYQNVTGTQLVTDQWFFLRISKSI